MAEAFPSPQSQLGHCFSVRKFLIKVTCHPSIHLTLFMFLCWPHVFNVRSKCNHHSAFQSLPFHLTSLPSSSFPPALLCLLTKNGISVIGFVCTQCSGFEGAHMVIIGVLLWDYVEGKRCTARPKKPHNSSSSTAAFLCLTFWLFSFCCCFIFPLFFHTLFPSQSFSLHLLLIFFKLTIKRICSILVHSYWYGFFFVSGSL